MFKKKYKSIKKKKNKYKQKNKSIKKKKTKVKTI